MATKKRLIDANACLHDMCERCNTENEGCPCEPTDCFIYNVIVNASTVDAMEVVRCKDCAYYNGRYCTESADWKAMHPNGFCSEGERKDDVITD